MNADFNQLDESNIAAESRRLVGDRSFSPSPASHREAFASFGRGHYAAGSEIVQCVTDCHSTISIAREVRCRKSSSTVKERTSATFSRRHQVLRKVVCASPEVTLPSALMMATPADLLATGSHAVKAIPYERRYGHFMQNALVNFHANSTGKGSICQTINFFFFDPRDSGAPAEDAARTRFQPGRHDQLHRKGWRDLPGQCHARYRDRALSRCC